MDQQLKQRLIGVTIAVALVVIFVPMLFEKSDEKGKLAATGVPPIPDTVLEKPLELPQSAADIAAKEKEKEQEAHKEEGKAAPAGAVYKMVPFNEEPAAKPKVTAQASAKPVSDEEGEEEAEDDPAESKPVKSAPDPVSEAAPPDEEAPPANPPKQTKPIVPPVVSRPAISNLAPPPKQTTTPLAKSPAVPAHVKTDVSPAAPKAKPPTAPATDIAPKKPLAVKKPETTKPAETPHTPIKTVKVNRSKPAPLLPDADDEGEPVPAPAKPAESKAKPKSVAVAPSRPVSPSATGVVKKPETAKPAEPQHATAKVGTVSKPAEDPKAAKKPTSWVIHAGSFVNESSAKNVAEKLKQSKVPASVKTVQGEHGPVYRVQVSPEHDRGRAEETLKRIQGAGVDSYITPQH
jgi:DedD protein